MSSNHLIASTLRSVGLTQGEDFVVRGYHERVDGHKVRTATRVQPLTDLADNAIAEHKDTIESRSGFTVKVHWTRSKKPVCHLYGPA